MNVAPPLESLPKSGKMAPAVPFSFLKSDGLLDRVPLALRPGRFLLQDAVN
jgi:hypothetical protein